MAILRFSVLHFAITLAVGFALVPQANAAAISAESQAVRDAIDLNSATGCSQIYGFNYQPSWGSNGLTVWGDNFDAAQYRTELTRGKEYFPEFNTVRMWLSWSAYRADSEQFMNNFQQAVDICGDLDLLVVPVMFNRWVGNPSWDLVQNTEIASDFNSTFAPYVNDLVTSMQGDSRILAWDLCNEPPLGTGTEVQWLTNVRDTVKQIDPQALTCIGTVTVEQTSTVAHLQDILTPHIYNQYTYNIAGYRQLAENQGKPMMSTECCWGALDDAERVALVQQNLSVLKQNGMGFFPHALQESYVADLHRPEYGPVGDPGYMAFVHMDGSLREGHDVYNAFTQEATQTEMPFIIDDHSALTAAGTTAPHTTSEVSPGFSLTGSWSEGYYPTGTNGVPAVGGGYSWPTSSPATAIYTPGDVEAFQAGTYDLYVSWGVWRDNTVANYTINHAGGTEVLNINNLNNASQGSTNGLLPNTAGSGSGFYYLGTYALDEVSNVVFSGNGQVDALMLRTSKEGRYLDHQSAHLSTSNPDQWHLATAPTVPSGNYAYSVSTEWDTTVTWSDLVDEAGTYDLKISWGVYGTHSNDIKYLVDIDGDGQQDANDLLVSINQALMADQLIAGSGLWSGFYDLGSFDFTLASQILQWNDGIGAITVAPMLVTKAIPSIPGDANNDGKVDGSDVTILAGNWQVLSGATWTMGDFNGDGKVDGSDVTILAGNWQYGTASAAATAVPEPGMLALCAWLGAFLFCYRKRTL